MDCYHYQPSMASPGHHHCFDIGHILGSIIEFFVYSSLNDDLESIAPSDVFGLYRHQIQIRLSTCLFVSRDWYYAAKRVQWSWIRFDRANQILKDDKALAKDPPYAHLIKSISTSLLSIFSSSKSSTTDQKGTRALTPLCRPVTKALMRIIGTATNLKVLQLDILAGWKDPSSLLEMLATGGPNRTLRTVNLHLSSQFIPHPGHPKNFSRFETQEMARDLVAALSSSPVLEHLSLADFDIRTGLGLFLPNLLRPMSKIDTLREEWGRPPTGLGRLKSLSLTRCDFNAKDLLWLCSSPAEPKLKTLELAHLPNMSYEDYAEFFQNVGSTVKQLKFFPGKTRPLGADAVDLDITHLVVEDLQRHRLLVQNDPNFLVRYFPNLQHASLKCEDLNPTVYAEFLSKQLRVVDLWIDYHDHYECYERLVEQENFPFLQEIGLFSINESHNDHAVYAERVRNSFGCGLEGGWEVLILSRGCQERGIHLKLAYCETGQSLIEDWEVYEDIDWETIEKDGIRGDEA